MLGWEAFRKSIRYGSKAESRAAACIIRSQPQAADTCDSKTKRKSESQSVGIATDCRTFNGKINFTTGAKAERKVWGAR